MSEKAMKREDPEAKRQRLITRAVELISQLQDREVLWLAEAARRDILGAIERAQLEALGVTRLEQPHRFHDTRTLERRSGDNREALASLDRRLEATDAILELVRHVGAGGFESVASQLRGRR